MNDDRKLDELLRQRSAAPDSESLADRILARSREVEQQLSVVDWLRALFAESLHHGPAFVLSAMLIIGIVTGAAIDRGLLFRVEQDQSIAGLVLYDDQGLL